MDNSIENLIIIGSGPAGFTAAIYASRANLFPTVFVGPVPGGQLTETTTVENFPGFPKGVLATELMDMMRQQAEKFGSKVIDQIVTKVDFSKNPYSVYTTNNQYLAKSIIIATGASAKWLDIPSEKKLKGKGISACATCDGPLYRNKDVAVIGGGDSAMEEALFLAKFASSVTIIHRREEFRASKIMLNRAHQDQKIKFLTNLEIVEYIGEKKLQSIRVKNTVSGEEKLLEFHGVFLAVGHHPNTDLFKDFLPLDEKKYIETTKAPLTELPGIFVAGDVADHRYRQAISAAGSGCQAAVEAEKYLCLFEKNK